ncbi:cytokine receptor common subunit beta isoform X2 [Denticeps clupeoides]|uniref:cytokine receptor common subunit beta isoform X2 n=1 Tax=Denticeps clupeoides TaxID=299321 RepID=UPI0010A3C135|nr:cytokine receptor common subunit beta isoform X2 [Denticeps clupeoides]
MGLVWVVRVVCVVALSQQVSGSTDDLCHNHKSENEFPGLNPLQCNNDYQSHIRCKWTENEDLHSRSPLSLYVLDNGRSPCVPDQPPERLPAGQLLVQCRYNTTFFSIGVKHAFYFGQTCPHTRPKSLTLPQQGKIRTPQHLTVAVKDEGYDLSWKSPYVQASALAAELCYQVTYGTDGQDWTTVDLNHTQLMIDRRALMPSHYYQARVRAKAGRWQWSDWSPLVAWKTAADMDLSPANLQCVLESEDQATCTWEMSREQTQFFIYHLMCYGQSDTKSTCCHAPKLAGRHSDSRLVFSCTFGVSSPELSVQLTPVRNTKIFEPHENIRPPKPDPLRIEQNNQDWHLKWARPKIPIGVLLMYQLCYWAEESGVVQQYDLTDASQSLLLPASKLNFSSKYHAKIRALVQDQTYKGPPSEWSDPVEWRTHPAPFAMAYVFYFGVAVAVCIIFVALVICQRRIAKWKLSLPSPGQSKVMTDVIKSAPPQFVHQNGETEKTYICVVQASDDNSLTTKTRSSEEHLWWSPDKMKDDEFQQESTSRGSKSSQQSSYMSFSGPYIFCKNESDQAFREFVPPCLTSSSITSSPSSTDSFLSTLSEGRQGYFVVPSPDVPMQTDTSETIILDTSKAENQDAHKGPQKSSCPPVSVSHDSHTDDPPSYTCMLPAFRLVIPQHSDYCCLPGIDLYPRGSPGTTSSWICLSNDTEPNNDNRSYIRLSRPTF